MSRAPAWLIVALVGCSSSGGGSGSIAPGADSGSVESGTIDASPLSDAADDGVRDEAGRVDAPPAAWNPSFSLGAPGWRNSKVPYCRSNAGDGTTDIWSDARGVFVAVSMSCNVLAGVACGHEGTSLQFNDGSGWKTIYRSSATDPLRLTGFDGGAAVLSGGNCGIELVDPASGAATCTPVLSNGGVFVVDANSAYGWDGTMVMHFDGAQWTPLAQPVWPISAIWADQHIAVTVGLGQAIYFKADGSTLFQLLPNVPVGDYFSVWGFSATDIWAGNTAGQLVHYDGVKWQVYETGSTDGTGSGVAQLWGAAGQLYFRTNTEFGRWNGTSAELIVKRSSPDRNGFSAMWGNSPSEVFLAIGDAQYGSSTCGGQFIVYYDGSQFHEF